MKLEGNGTKEERNLMLLLTKGKININHQPGIGSQI